MKKEDIEFLNELQHEMLTQDTVGQANPRFWVVMQTIREYNFDDDATGIYIYSKSDGETVFEGKLEESVEWLKELEGIEDCQYILYNIEFTYKDTERSLYDVDGLQCFLDKYDKFNYRVGYYRDREEIVENTMFLTLRECEEHIKANSHHYNKAHPYAMTAWKSPQVERLYEILEKTDWENVNVTQ